MARPNKIWWWEQRGEWAVTIKGKRHRLGADRGEAERQFHAILAKKPEEPVKIEPGSVVELLDRFLDEEDWKSEDTRLWYNKHCQSFTDYLKVEGLSRLMIGELAPHHVKNWLKSHTTWADGTKNGACRAVQRAIRWCHQMGYIKANPIVFVPGKPAPGRRENPITPAEYDLLISHVRDREFREVLEIAWTCGARPQELLRVERHNVEIKNHRWVFAPDEGKVLAKRKIRYVYLTDNALAITRRLMVKYPEGPLFRNTDGNPWTPYSIDCRFKRLEKHLGKKVALYDIRHSFTERLRQRNVDSVNISALLGHADLSLLGKTYAHPHLAPEYLWKILNEAQ